MRHLKSLAIATVAALAIGCAGTGTNTAKVYDPQQNTIQLKAATTDTSIKSVTYTLDGTTKLGTSTDTANGFTLNFDTTQVKNGIHTVQGVADTGATIVDNTLFISNAVSGGGTPASTAPSTSASSASTGPSSPAPSDNASASPSASTSPSPSPSAGASASPSPSAGASASPSPSPSASPSAGT